MNSYYFTFGSDPLFPYGRGSYVVVAAPCLEDAISLFKLVHPNRPGSNLLNCAAYYTENQFSEFRDRYYKDVQPSEVISLQIKKGGF